MLLSVQIIVKHSYRNSPTKKTQMLWMTMHFLKKKFMSWTEFLVALKQNYCLPTIIFILELLVVTNTTFQNSLWGTG